MKKQTIIKTGLVSSLGLTAFVCAAISPAVFGLGTNGNVRLDTEVATSIAMKIVSPNDVNPDCTPESGATYGEVNRYASSTGDDSGKMVDTFNGNEGEADEVNTNTSCATLSMTPNTFDSTYSDVTVYTNSGTGYAVTVQSAENTSPNLVNVSDNTQYIPAGTLTETNNEVSGGQNKWAMKTDTGVMDTWTAASASPALVRAYDQATNNGDTTRVTYGISAGSNPTGKYSTTLTYTATMFDGTNPYISKITIPTVANLTISADSLDVPYGQTKTITVTPASGYYLSGVTCPTGFTCTGYSTDKSESASAAAQTVTITNNNTNATGTLAFTASLIKTFAEITTMQEMNSGIVADAAAGAYKTLTDTRGGSYTVAKLLDGNIWMTQNLNLYNKTLTPEDSNVSSNFTIPNSSTANWCKENSAACDNQSMALYSDNATYGTYYNWYTATAGTGTYEMSSGNATASICPKGWHLPTNTEFQAMYNQYGSSAAIRATGTNQPAFVLSGRRSGGSTNYQGLAGNYWASTASSNNYYAYDLYLDSSNVVPQSAYDKWSGFSVRCIAATQ